MFTGIVQEVFEVSKVEKKAGMTTYSIGFSAALLEGLKMGASVSVSGVCQTVVVNQGGQVTFDAIQETLERTTLQNLEVGMRVNIERAARLGDEIGGHSVSGHVIGRVRISKIENRENHQVFHFECPREWTKYLIEKGYVALDGASLTLGVVDPKGQFVIHLIPETLRRTTFGHKQVGDWINLELDSQTQTIVDTVERLISRSAGGLLPLVNPVEPAQGSGC